MSNANMNATSSHDTDSSISPPIIPSTQLSSTSALGTNTHAIIEGLGNGDGQAQNTTPVEFETGNLNGYSNNSAQSTVRDSARQPQRLQILTSGITAVSIQDSDPVTALYRASGSDNSGDLGTAVTTNDEEYGDENMLAQNGPANSGLLNSQTNPFPSGPSQSGRDEEVAGHLDPLFENRPGDTASVEGSTPDSQTEPTSSERLGIEITETVSITGDHGTSDADNFGNHGTAITTNDEEYGDENTLAQNGPATSTYEIASMNMDDLRPCSPSFVGNGFIHSARRPNTLIDGGFLNGQMNFIGNNFDVDGQATTTSVVNTNVIDGNRNISEIHHVRENALEGRRYSIGARPHVGTTSSEEAVNGNGSRSRRAPRPAGLLHTAREEVEVDIPGYSRDSR